MEENRQKLGVPIAIVIAGVLIAGAIFFSKSGGEQVQNNKVGTKPAEIELAPVGPQDYMLGNPKAPFYIVEYSDPECPFCKNFHQTMKRVMQEYGEKGSVAWVYRHFPIAVLHSKAQREAEAMECAGELGGNSGFFKYADRLYEVTPSNDGLDPKELFNIASYTGLEAKAFSECLESGRKSAKVKADYESGVKAGAQGTPYSVILTRDGTKIPLEGALPYSEVKNILDTLLK